MIIDIEDKKESIRCQECNSEGAEYFLTEDKEAICKECLIDLLFDEALEDRVACIEGLETENPDDRVIIEKVWDNQKFLHSEIRIED